MTLHRYSRVHGLSGEVTVDVRTVSPSFQVNTQVVAVTAEDATLTVKDWDRLVAETNTLLGRDEGSVVLAADV